MPRISPNQPSCPNGDFLGKDTKAAQNFHEERVTGEGKRPKEIVKNSNPEFPGVLPFLDPVLSPWWNLSAPLIKICFFHHQNTAFISQVNVNVLTPYFTSPTWMLPEKRPKRRCKVKQGMHDSTGRKLLCWVVKMVHKNTGNCTVAQGYLFPPCKKES